MKKVQRCPVCLGNGLVPSGFYSQVSDTWNSTVSTPETCKSCDGKGIVWEPEITIEHEKMP